MRSIGMCPWVSIMELVVLILFVISPESQSFTVETLNCRNPSQFRVLIANADGDDSSSAVSSTRLEASAPRQPRRKLQKRQRRVRPGTNRLPRREDADGGSSDPTNSKAFWASGDVRPLVADRQKELGQDYWVDTNEMAAYEERQAAIKAREPGQVPDDKLWSEILSPYKQNWIGWISIGIVVISTIVTKFPELLNYPVIQIPDL